MLTLILFTGYAACLARLAAACRIHRRQHVYPALVALQLLSAARMFCGLNFSFAIRQQLYSIGAPLEVCLHGLALLEIYRAVTTNHFPARIWGSRLLGAFVALAVAASFASHLLWQPTWPWAPGILALERYADIVVAVVVACTWAFLRKTAVIPESQAARRGVAVFGWDAALGLLSLALLGSGWGSRSWWVVGVLPVAADLSIGLLWALAFAPACRLIPAVPPVDREALTAGIARMDRREAQLRSAVAVMRQVE